jgi:hypothetical protein
MGRIGLASSILASHYHTARKGINEAGLPTLCCMGWHRHFPIGIQTQKKKSNAKPEGEKTVQYSSTNIKN